jgi:manganese transport protein
LCPSLIVIFIGLDPTKVLIFSQVILSFGLPFAVIPLVRFTSQKRIMGVLINQKGTTVVATLVAGLIIALNLYLLYATFVIG